MWDILPQTFGTTKKKDEVSEIDSPLHFLSSIYAWAFFFHGWEYKSIYCAAIQEMSTNKYGRNGDILYIFMGILHCPRARC